MPKIRKADKFRHMNKLANEIEKLLNRLFELRVGILMWVAGFSGIMAVRTFIKTFVVGRNQTVDGVLTDYLHEFFFFFIAILMVWLLVSLLLKENPANLSGLFFWASWLIIFPPLIDMAKTGGGIFWSFYLLGGPAELWRYFASAYGDLPSGIVYFGTRIVCLVSVAAIALLIWARTKNLVKAAAGLIGVYLIWFFMGAIPTFLTYAYYFLEGSKKIVEIRAVDVMQFLGGMESIFGMTFDNFGYTMAYNINLAFHLMFLGLLAVLFILIGWEKFWAVVKNSRPPQLVYHAGLLFIGLGLGFLAYPENFHLNIFSVMAVLILIASAWLAWLAAVVFNDLADFEIDQVSNAWRPLQKGIFQKEEYRQLGVVFFLLSLLGGLVISPKLAGLFLVYQFISWAYSAKPYRLKRFPLVATLVSAAASLVILFIGFTLFSGDQNLHGLSARVVFLILISLTLSIPIKDFKDIAGDKKDGIRTIPVLLGEEKGRLAVAGGVFVSFMLSVFLLNEARLFGWALIFGGIAFWMINSKKIHPRQLLGWILAPVIAYGLIMVRIVFL